MLSGQEIGLYETLLISLLGMAVVLVSLALLMGFVLLFGKITSGKKPVATVSQSVSDASEEEIAAITAALSLEHALNKHSFVVASVTPQGRDRGTNHTNQS
jgi:Na+-transporting methylmalonyl-CoA/oxaloacetate decarboxylase gamma subunit